MTLILQAAWVLNAPAAPPLLLRRLLQPGVRAQLQTVQGETLRVDQFHLSTPQDFDAIPPDQAVLTFSSTPEPPDFDQIQKITLSQLTPEWQSSSPDAIETYWLGNIRAAVPAPPDWKRSSHQIPPWKPAQPTRDVGGLPFLNHATFCWGPPKPETEKELGVYLFRQSFNIQNPDDIARATLRIATNSEPLEAALNEYPIHLGGEHPFAVAEFEVTPLIQGGPNIFAIKVRERPGIPAAGHGLAFHLELIRRSGLDYEPPPLDPMATLITGANGDRVWGWVRNLSGQRALLSTAYGLYNLDWPGCTGLLFPAGWNPEPPRRRALSPATPPPPANLQRFGLPLSMQPQSLQNALLLTEGRMTTAHPTNATDDKLYCTGDGGNQYAMALNEVLGIYPPRPAEVPFQRPRAHVGILQCRVAMATGEVLCGLLRELNSERLVLESAGGEILALKSDYVSEILFPYHAAALPPERPEPGPVGLLPLAGGQAEYKNAYAADARHVQAACFAMEVNCAPLAPPVVADPAQLSPDQYPVLVSIDPVGQYLHTLASPGDAQEALLQYVAQGGSLVVLSRGGALRTAVKNEGGQYVAGAAVKPSILDQLQIRTQHPTDPPRPGTSPFDHPPNSGGPFYGQRTAQVPVGLAALPARIELAAMTSAPFYPMTAGEGRMSVLYDLTDAGGTFYGPALAVIKHGQGRLIVIDHLLWESQIDGQPFSERLLPILIRWAIEQKK